MTLPFAGATIVFDLDGTLVDTAPDLAAATSHVLSLAGLAPITVAELHPFIGAGSRAMIESGLRLRGAVLSEAEFNRLHEQFFAYYEAHIADLSRPFQGVVEALDTLAAGGAQLAVCTNKYEHLSRALLEQLGIASRFAAIAGRDTFDVYKPNPGHLLQTIAAVKGDPRRAIMVGDSDVDLATARNAKVPAIGVTFGYTTKPVREIGAEAIIDHYREFIPAAERLLGA